MESESLQNSTSNNLESCTDVPLQNLNHEVSLDNRGEKVFIKILETI